MPRFARFQRHFLSWDRPWLPRVAEWLADGWSGVGPLDLSGMLAIVPTRQAGRRLREALAEFAARRGQAVFPPRAYTPDTLLTVENEEAGIASRLEALLAWASVLREADLAGLPDVLPVPPPRRDFAWSWRLGERLFRLQTQLNEIGMTFAEVPQRAGADFPEAERWRQLAQLEDRQARALTERGRREPHAVRRQWAREAPVPAGVRRIVVLGTPDPLPLALEALERWAERVPVEVVVFASDSERDAFDAAGRPLPGAWRRRVLALPEFERQVRLCFEPAAEAEFAAEIAGGYPQPEGLLALGIADPDVVPLLEGELSRRGIASYNPEGRARRSESLHTLLAALGALGRDANFEALEQLARAPDFLAALRRRFGGGYSAARFLLQLDELRARHLPANLAVARAAIGDRQDELARGLGFMAELHEILRASPFPENAAQALGALFAGRVFRFADPADSRDAENAEAWREAMQACARARRSFPELSSDDWWEVALRLFGDGRTAGEKAPGALELQGWLEVLWDDAPHLVVVGMNEGVVPEAIVGDAFLPESLRQKLGLKTNALRFARDAYLLESIVRARAESGRVDILLAKNSPVGEPLRPSRLLLQCSEAELPERIRFLFREAEAQRPNLPWTRAWRLVPRQAPAPTRVPVTGLRTWLACPFRFYLRHVLQMEPVEPGKTELDARDFGTLCHSALEAMARDAAMQDCTDETELRDFLWREFDLAAQRRFGGELALPLIVQLESARQRLARVAALQARERSAGWRIERCEWPFTLMAGGLEVRGKIDRIDRHETSGAWRVLDYKTSDVGVSPGKSHLRPFRAGDERLPEWMRVEREGREFVWADLQLPIYMRAMALEPNATLLSCGYINLPKAVGETALALWPELDRALLEAAHTCTEGVAAAISAGEFWPPAEMPPQRDPFATLFHRGAAESVAWPAPR